VLSADQARAERLLARHMRAISRVADPRQRRQRAYALLARNGFDAEICRTVAVGLESADVQRDGRVEDDG